MAQLTASGLSSCTWCASLIDDDELRSRDVLLFAVQPDDFFFP